MERLAENLISGGRLGRGDDLGVLLEMDLDKIAAAAHPAVVITVVTNTDDFKDVEVVASGAVEPENTQTGVIDRKKKRILCGAAKS